MLILLALTGAARADGSGPSFGSPSHFTEQGGAAIYASVCAGCHMPDGRGAIGAAAYPALARNGRLAAAGYPIDRILHGRGAMPAFSRTLSDMQVAEVVDFIRTNFGNSFVPGPLPADIAAAR